MMPLFEVIDFGKRYRIGSKTPFSPASAEANDINIVVAVSVLAGFFLPDDYMLAYFHLQMIVIFEKARCIEVINGHIDDNSFFRLNGSGVCVRHCRSRVLLVYALACG